MERERLLFKCWKIVDWSINAIKIVEFSFRWEEFINENQFSKVVYNVKQIIH